MACGTIDWDWIAGEIAALHSESGRSGIETRFASVLLRYAHAKQFNRHRR